MRNDIAISLEELLGKAYTDAVSQAAVTLLDVEPEIARRCVEDKVEFFPESYVEKIDSLLDKVGQKVTEPFKGDMEERPPSRLPEPPIMLPAPSQGLDTTGWDRTAGCM